MAMRALTDKTAGRTTGTSEVATMDTTHGTEPGASWI
jgi:hypothetical protein